MPAVLLTRVRLIFYNGNVQLICGLAHQSACQNANICHLWLFQLDDCATCSILQPLLWLENAGIWWRTLSFTKKIKMDKEGCPQAANTLQMHVV